MAINYRLKNSFLALIFVANQIVFYSNSPFLEGTKLISEKWGWINKYATLCSSSCSIYDYFWIGKRSFKYQQVKLDVAAIKGCGNMKNELLPRKLSALIDIRKKKASQRNGMKYVKQPICPIITWNSTDCRFTKKKAKIYVNLLIYFDYATKKKSERNFWEKRIWRQIKATEWMNSTKILWC